MFLRYALYGVTVCALLLGSVPGAAQPLVKTSSPGGMISAITVTGRGSVRVPADRMRVVVRIFGRSGATATGADIDSAGKTIAEALRAHGMPDAAWVLPLNGTFGQNGGVAPQIVGTVDKPTREHVETIMRDTLKALPDALATVVQNAQIQTSLFLTDCSGPEARAQKAALEDAHRRAETIARAAGVRLGSVVAVNEQGFPQACVSSNDAMFGYNPQNNFDAFGPLDVAIVVTATVSYAIL